MMFLTHCVMELIVLAVLSLCLPVWSAVQVIQPYTVKSTNGMAQIQCFVHPRPSFSHIQPPHKQSPPYPYPGPEELRVSLLKGLHGNERVCSSFLNFTEQEETGFKRNGEVQCSARLRGGEVEVTVSGLTASDTDMYRCQIEVFFPPPYLQLTGNGTLIHILDSSDCLMKGAYKQIEHKVDEEEDDEGDEKMEPVSVPVCVLLIAIILVLSIIIYFQTLQCQQGKREIVRPVPGVLHKLDVAAFSHGNVV